MLLKYISCKMYFLVMGIFFLGNSLPTSQVKIPILEGKIKRLTPFGMPDTKNESYFYGIYGLACSEEGKLFLTDQQAAAVRVFSLETGKELYRFGRSGGGPGEFRELSKIKLLENGKISIIDNILRRWTLFEQNGRLYSTTPLAYLTDDVDFVDSDLIILSDFKFDFNFKPLRTMVVSTGKMVDEFGTVINPRSGLIEKFSTLPGSDKEFYSRGWLSSVMVLPSKNEVIYSQRHPYSVVKYVLNTKTQSIVNPVIDVDTDDKMILEISDNGRRIGRSPSGQVLQPMIRGSSIMVPIFSADGQRNYLDCYDLKANFKKRLRIPPLPKNATPVWSTFRGTKELLVLVRDEVGINWIERFALDLS